ncbi:hypothetical protein OpiT1DRAFT_03842 [Opitutaceae bacterium TAV1]|nr:hypothetical protein OpiT1DRAFT_03842 [Opitutaceae bacterium TAV1]
MKRIRPSSNQYKPRKRLTAKQRKDLAAFVRGGTKS